MKRKSPFSKGFWLDKGLSEEEAEYKVKTFRPTNIEYWISKGYSEDEAKEQLKCHQQKSCKSLNKKRSSSPEMRTTNIEYWLSKGYSEDEAKEQLKSRQTTFSKDICIEKHGVEDGVKKWEERQNKWIQTLSEKTETELKDINKRKAITESILIEKYGEELGKEKWIEINNIRSEKSKEAFIRRTENGTSKNFYSDEGIRFFTPIFKFCIDNGFKESDIFWGLSSEWFIRDNQNIFFYDFTIKPLNIIIEYHGECFHPNSKILSETEWDEWKQLFTGLDANTCKKKDDYKKNLAISNGFIYYEIYSQDNLIDKTKDLINEINHKICRD